MVDILAIASRPVGPTRILYNANLSYSQMRKYLDLLTGVGLLAEHGGSCRVYQTTKKGLEFLAILGKRETSPTELR